MTEPTKKSAKLEELSGRELGTFLAQLSKLVGMAPLSDRRLAKALRETGNHFARLGGTSYRQALVQEERRDRKGRPAEDFKDAELKRIERMLSDPDTRRAQLIDMAVSRFGISRALLDRKSIEAVREEIGTAVRHESSISIISDVARRGDKRN